MKGEYNMNNSTKSVPSISVLANEIAAKNGCSNYWWPVMRKICSRLIDEGYLEMQGNISIPTEKGRKLGLYTVECTNDRGENYTKVAYDKNAQKYVDSIFMSLKAEVDKENGGHYLTYKEKKDREYARGEFHGRTICFKRRYGEHELSDEEVTKLLNGQIIKTILAKGTYPVRGRLQQLRGADGKRFYYRFVCENEKYAEFKENYGINDLDR